MIQPKKHLGQHFLKDKNICQKIALTFGQHEGCSNVLEIGPGTGALTEFLLRREEINVEVMDVDTESIAYLNEHFPLLSGKIHEADFLKEDLTKRFEGEPFAVVGNFPYNISSQIVFKCIENRERIPEIMGMFQREMAQRIAEKPGSKQYGIISVITQAFYDVHYCFTVDEHVFNPPPKVKSGVIRCIRKPEQSLGCDEKKFIQVVKTAFNQRRKTMRNSLKTLLPESLRTLPILERRPETMSVAEFVDLTKTIMAAQGLP